MSNPPNPYANALDGLVLEDPVQAFFDFCKERESIRVRKEGGEPWPWTEDPILQRGRFLNVFREDDRGTKAVLRFLEGAKTSPGLLVQAALFARWCNKDVTLDGLDASMLEDPESLQKHLERLRDQPVSYTHLTLPTIYSV